MTGLLNGLKFYEGTPAHEGMIGSGDNSNWGTIDATSPYTITSNGTIKNLSGDAQSGYSFSDNYNDPNGKSEKDQLGVTYSFDPKTGTATPTSSQTYYQPGDWVGQYRDVAKILGTVLAAGAGGAALAAGGAGGAGGAGAAAGAGAAEAGGAAAAGSGYTFGSGAGLSGGGAFSSGLGMEGFGAGLGGTLSSAGAVGGELGSLAGYGAMGGLGADLTMAGAGAAAGGAAPASSTGFLDQIAKGNYLDALKTGGSSLVDWVTKNPGTALQLGSMLGGAVAGGSGGSGGGGSGGSGGSYTPQPVARGGWQSSVTPQFQQQPAQQPAGLLANPQGEANDGLWRYNKNGLLG